VGVVGAAVVTAFVRVKVQCDGHDGDRCNASFDTEAALMTVGDEVKRLVVDESSFTHPEGWSPYTYRCPACTKKHEDELRRYEERFSKRRK
jgi:hypothetical protein